MDNCRRWHHIWHLLMVMAVAGVLSSRSLAQGAPRPLGQDITGSTQISDEQRAAIKAYADYWCGMLNDEHSKPDQVEKARAELIRPLQQIQQNISPSFRFEYSKTLVPCLEQPIKCTSLHAAVNSIIVASKLGTDRAINLLLAHTDLQTQSCWQIRLQAAFGCQGLLQGEALDVRKMSEAVKKLRDAAKREDNNLVLRHQLAAIDAADHSPLKPEERQQMRAALVDAVITVVDQIARNAAAPEPSPLVDGVHSAVVLLRSKFVQANTMQGPEKEDVAKKLGPSLGQLLSYASTHWTAIQADENAKKRYGMMVGSWEGFLGHLATSAKPGGNGPATELRKPWDTGDKAKFDTDLRLWLDIVNQPPYIKR